jgi:predicted dehydrogenase
MLRIGLIGAGWHAASDHAPALRHCAAEPEFRGAVELTGVCDIDALMAAEVASSFGFRRAYESIEAMLPEVDAVVSVVPPEALVAALVQFVRYKRPVLFEKPLGTSLGETERIEQMLEGHPHMVSLNRRFDPAVVMARGWMSAQGSSPRAIHGLMARHNRLERDFVWSTGIHLSDLMCHLVGPLKLIAARAAAGAGAGRVGLLEGRDRMCGTINYHPACGRVDETVHIVGDDWATDITTGTHQPWRVRCWRSGRAELDVTADPTAPEFERNGTCDETRTFLRALLRRGTFGPTVADAMPGTALAAALQNADVAPGA